MKNLFIVALLAFGITAFSQDRKEMGNRPDRPMMEKISPEQRNQLMLKKMTLELDLNVQQQEQVSRIIAERGVKWEAMKAEHKAKKEYEKRPTADDIFAMKIKMLDEQIDMQNKMKGILSPEQFKDWKCMKEKFQEKRHDKDDWKKGDEKNR